MPEDLKKTLRIMLDMGLRLNDWRQAQIATLCRVAARCSDLTKRLREWARSPAHVREASKSVNVGLLVVLIEASGWPDHSLPLAFLEGFNVVGVIESSGVLRPLSQSESVEDFTQRADDIARGRTLAPSNAEWLHLAERQVRSSFSTASPEALEGIQRASRMTQDEVRAGTMLPGITVGEFVKMYTVDGVLHGRPMRRYAVRQGTKEVRQPDGSIEVQVKWRCIDDGRRSMSNSMCWTEETITLPNFRAPATMAIYLAEQCTVRHQPPPVVGFGTDDLKLAYRRIPSRKLAYTAVIMWCCEAQDVRIFRCPGHNFGLVASVPNC